MQTAASTPNSISDIVDDGKAPDATDTTGSASRNPSESRALVLAQDVRDQMQRRRRQRRAVFVGIVLATMIAALAWGAWLSPHRYAAEMRFSVRGNSGGSTGQSGAAGLLSGGAGGSGGMGFVDGFAVNDYLKSRDAAMGLAQRVDLPRLLGVDKSRGTEALYQTYRDAVAIKFNMVEQENVVVVSAPDPKAAQLIAENLLALAQAFVGRMDQQGVQNMLDVDAEQLQKAEDQASMAANAVAAWRTSNRNVDPEAETQMVMTMIGQIEQELNAARISLEKVRAVGNPQHPMLQSAQTQVDSLEAQLAAARRRLTGGDDSQASKLRSYTRLKNAETFAQTSLAAAREAYQGAYRETTRLRRYLSVIARPVAQDAPTRLNLWLLALEGLLAGVVLALMVTMAWDMLRSGRD